LVGLTELPDAGSITLLVGLPMATNIFCGNAKILGSQNVSTDILDVLRQGFAEDEDRLAKICIVWAF
jgi:hypothetical protein